MSRNGLFRDIVEENALAAAELAADDDAVNSVIAKAPNKTPMAKAFDCLVDFVRVQRILVVS